MPSLRHLPPTAVPIRVRDLWRGLHALRRPTEALEEFSSAVQGQTGRPACFLLSSGRAALTVILLGLKRLSRRTRVIVPAYGCPTVVQSVLEAGLDPVLCDVSPQTLDFERHALDQLIGPDLLAVVPVHLYGLVQDVRPLVAAGRVHGFSVVEDAAQAYGATFRGRMAGTWGDAGLYSLGWGKCLPAGHGGFIVANEQLAPAIGQVFSEVQGLGSRRHHRWDLGALAQYVAYGMATHPAGWWFVARSSLNPAQEGMDAHALPPIHLRGLSVVRAGIAASILERLQDDRTVRRRNANQLVARLSECGYVSFPEIPPGGDPIFLRLPTVLDTQQRADRLFDRLHAAGIGVSRSYWRALPELFSGMIETTGGFPGASRLATSLLTLPTHSYLTERDVERTVRLVRAG